MSVGANLKRLREEKNLTQMELANLVSVSGPMICQIERGTKSPTIALVMELAKALDCDINEIAN